MLEPPTPCFIGYGIFTSLEIKAGDFIAEYKGKLVSKEEGEKLEDHYSQSPKNGKESGSFLYLLVSLNFLCLCFSPFSLVVCGFNLWFSGHYEGLGTLGVVLVFCEMGFKSKINL